MSLKVGIAGLRRGAGVANVFLNHKDCKVVAGCDLKTDLAKSWTEEHDVPYWFDDYTKFCEADLDAILIATPGPTHVPCAIEALAHGKHIMSEVPAAYSLEQARDLAAAVEKSGLKYMFAENVCYYAWVDAYRQMIQRGDLGEIIYAEGEYIHNCESLMQETAPDGTVKKTWRASLPPILYPTHDLGPLLMIMQDRVVSAVGMHTGNRRRPDLGVIDMEVGIFKTAKGNVIKQLCGFSVAKEPAHHWFVLYGTKGQIESPRFPGAKHRLYREDIPHLGGQIELPLSDTHKGAPPEAFKGGHGTSEYYMVNDFIRCILDDTKPPIDVYEGLDQTLPGICAHLSAEQGSIPVEVPDLRPS